MSGENATLTSGVCPGLTIRLFGGMAILDHVGASFLPRSRKTRAIVAMLALSAPRPVLRMRLTSLLWSRREKEQARASLRQAVHEIQDTLGTAWSRVLVAERHHLSMDPRLMTVDALTAAAPAAPRTELLELLREGFLEDLEGLDPGFDSWLGQERQRLVALARLSGEAGLHESQTEAEAMASAKSLLQIDPSHDGAWRVLIEGHIKAGDRAAALFAWEQWREAAGLAPGDSPPPDMARFLTRIRAGPGTNGAADESPSDPTPERETGVPPGQVELMPGRGRIRLGVREMRVVGAESDLTFATGLTEEVTTALSRFRWISCVSGASLSAIVGPTVDGEPPWSGIGLDLILDGTIQRGSNRLRITVRLLDMRTGGEIIWANRFDRPSGDPLTIQEEVAAAIVAQVDPVLLIREGERAAYRGKRTATPRELVLQAVPAIYRLDREGFNAAGDLLEAALRVNPRATEALAWYAYWHLFQVGQGWAPDPDAATARAATLADNAVAADPNDARALTLAGHVRGFLMKRPVEAAVLHERAITLNPNLAIAWCFSGFAMSYLGDHETAVERMRQAIHLSPSDPHLFFFQAAIMMPHLLRGEYHAAMEAGRQAIELNPWFTSSLKGYLATLGHLGEHQEAAGIRARLLKLEPKFTVADAIRRSPMTRAEDVECYAEGLRRGGLPER
jgi:DNA-binding SARP family transcriptional activator/TolB-like protein